MQPNISGDVLQNFGCHFTNVTKTKHIDQTDCMGEFRGFRLV